MTAHDDDRPAAPGAEYAEYAETVPLVPPADTGQAETVCLTHAADAGQPETVCLTHAADAGQPETVSLTHAADAPRPETVPLTGSVGAARPETTPPPDSAAAEYSATVLASHWVQRPDPDRTLVAQPCAPGTAAAEPDRVEGTVLRFGPGVTAAGRTHRTLPALPQRPAPAGRRLRRHALPVLVLLCVLAFVAWQRLGPPLAVGSVTVTARPTALGCDGTADITGLVTTNGRPGTLSYRWVRSDGTSSGVLKEELVRGRTQARLHLRWTFQGQGEREARAELRILSPAPRTAAAGFTYSCR